MIFDGYGAIRTDVACRRLADESDVFRRRHLEKCRQGGMGGSIFVTWIDPPHTDRPERRFRQVVDRMRQDLAETGHLIGILKKRGYAPEDLEKTAFRNFYRVFQTAWALRGPCTRPPPA